MKDAHSTNVIGVFADSHAARAAVRFLEHAGFDADDVAVVSRDVRKARELTGSRSPQGAIVGGLIGLILFGAFVALGGSVMWSNPVALVFGVVVFLIAGVGIGTLAGRGRVFIERPAAGYEDAVAMGETLVSVHVTDSERDRARSLLREAGALSTPEEGTVEAA